MRLINTVLGTVIKMDSGEEIIAPACLSQAIQELKVKLENSEVKVRELHRNNEKQMDNITVMQEEVKALRNNLTSANNTVRSQEKLLINQAESIGTYQQEAKEKETRIANLQVQLYKEKLELPAATTAGDTDSPKYCKLHEYLHSEEAEAQRLDMYKAVMSTLKSRVLSATIPELIEVRQQLV